jgi:MFS family permease
MNDEPQRFPAAEYADGPLPNRFTRGTLMGCVGLLGVLALPLVLFLPLEDWGLARWVFLLVQLLAFCALGGGVWLVARVPSSARARSNDPSYPLTARGVAPVLERPARWPNWVGLGIVCALIAFAAAGFALAAFDTGRQAGISLGLAVTCVAGFTLAAYGFCVALGQLEPPALRWVRIPAIASWLPQGGSLMLIGLTLLGWALLIAAEAHFTWGALGLVALLLAVILVAPLMRQLPAHSRRMRR